MPRRYIEYDDYYDMEPSQRFIDALSENGFLYSILWPIVIDQMEEYDLDCLRGVNRFFARHAGLAKSKFILDVSVSLNFPVPD